MTQTKLAFNQINGNVVNVKDFGAVGDWDGTTGTDDTAAIQSAALALTDNMELLFPDGDYLVTALIDFTLKSGITIRGVKRGSRIRFNHSDAAGFDMDNGPFATHTERAISLIDMTFYAASTTAALPAIAVNMRSCPESTVQGCTFINCSTSKQLYLYESWSSSINNHNFFAAAESGLTTLYGAPDNSNAAGVGLHIGTDTHATNIENNRIRAGSPSLQFSGGDSCSIRGNSIESGTTVGILVDNSSASLEIENNYFEGGQSWDVDYTSSGTNFSHQIKNNFHHAIGGVRVQAGCSTNGMVISNNNHFSSTNGVKIEAITGFNGVKIFDNTFRNVTTPLDIPAASLLNIGLSYPANTLLLNNSFLGTSPKSGQFNSSSIDSIGNWATFAGTGSTSASSINHSGKVMDNLIGTSSWTAFLDYVFDNSMRDEYVTVSIPFITPAGTNVVVTIDDGVTTRGYTCNANATGSIAVNSLFYYKMSATATKLRVRVNVGTLTIQTIKPAIRMGAHDDLVFI